VKSERLFLLPIAMLKKRKPKLGNQVVCDLALSVAATIQRCVADGAIKIGERRIGHGGVPLKELEENVMQDVLPGSNIDNE